MEPSSGCSNRISKDFWRRASKALMLEINCAPS